MFYCIHFKCLLRCFYKDILYTGRYNYYSKTSRMSETMFHTIQPHSTNNLFDCYKFLSVGSTC